MHASDSAAMPDTVRASTNQSGSKLRIVFMGSPEFAIPSLDRLARTHDVCAVYSQPAKKSGRGMKRVLPAAIVILISVMAVLAIVRVRFSSDVFELLPQDLPEARGLEQINRYFSRDAQLIITLDGQSARSVSEATASLASTLSQQKVFIADVFREVDMERIVAEGGPLVAWAWFNGAPESLALLERRLVSVSYTHLTLPTKA